MAGTRTWLLDRLGREGRRRLVAHQQPQPMRAGVFEDQDHLVVDADRQAGRPLAADAQPSGPARPSRQHRIDDECQEDQPEVAQHQPVQPGRGAGAGQPVSRPRKRANQQRLDHRVGES